MTRSERPSARRRRPGRDVTRDERRMSRRARRSRIEPDERSRHRTLVALVVLVGVLLAVGVPIYGAWRVLLQPRVDVVAGLPVEVEVPQGADTATIAEILEAAGVVDNAAMFRLRARLDEVDGKLRPGVYQLATGMPYELVVEELMAGQPVAYTTVTIPEGLTIPQIAARLEEKAGISSAEFTAIAANEAQTFAADHPYLADSGVTTLEGYLFPKTYRIVEGSTPRQVIELMLDQLDTELASVDLSYPTSKGLSFHDVMTAASIVEREARLDAERPLVASVIYNRLERDMKLEMCATVEYLLPGTRPRLTNDDLKIESPYNTYLYGGLPPGPIAAPGLASLKAVGEPASTKYLFYVLTGTDGSHTFAETYSEFLKAKARSREVVP